MKRIFILLLAVALAHARLATAQDAAVEERLNKLGGQIEDLLAAKAEQDKRMAALVREIEALREQLGKAGGNYASAEDVRKLAEAVKDVDQKRIADNEKIAHQIENLAKAAVGGGTGNRRAPKVEPKVENPERAGGGAEKGYEYVIAPGDTLSTIAQAYREKGVKVTVDWILKSNPGLKEKSLKVGQKIFFPPPPP